ncbi:4-hydroxybenzoyl-CoA thioesterase [Geothermobacter ehrlichii]|uniref:4-hydroxybenzoyl-CoA thioesterase n=1 Tax=Geothermobacter ehrlichii TaxID=213224 RepID=A0A5D3WQ43_9BACT|nr:thioesterase family protein [Geothermobacter ehrlichii]TYO99590.1 4-hydroxybenzoyl-CoA thioesterase [Geothermobacter ehrlichii]
MNGFRFTVPIRVRVADINYGGHVSNAVVLNFFQDGRIGYLERIGGFSELDIGGCGIILPEAHVHYRAEMFFGDELLIGVRARDLGRSSFVVDYRIERAGEVTAEGWTSLVAFDYARRRAVRLPAAFVEAVRKFEEME